MSVDDILSNVSRETIADLEAYSGLVLKWTKTINLISKSSHAELWSRHVMDSVQLWRHVTKCNHLLDLGSGGGFPGIVMAISAKHGKNIDRVTLVESDVRKCAFLLTVIRELDLPAKVITKRIEDLPDMTADCVTARALAPLSDLLGYVAPHLSEGGQCLLLKGGKADDEIQAARKDWSFSVEKSPSMTQTEASVLIIKELSRA